MDRFRYPQIGSLPTAIKSQLGYLSDMKKAIFLIVVLLSFTSCNRKKCWHCTSDAFQRIYYITPTWEQKYHNESQVCDKTEDEIRVYEQELTFYHADSLEEYGATVTCR